MNSPTVRDAPDSTTQWRPGGSLTIDRAAALWAEAQTHLASNGSGTIYVDLSAIERVDTAGCQILLACREDARRRGLGWTLDGCGMQIVEVMQLLGCVDVLGASVLRTTAPDATVPDADEDAEVDVNVDVDGMQEITKEIAQ
jgi:anti-anti-sigma regulatory factor